MQGALTGRLLSYDPSTSETEVLVSKLWFANGCALAEDESYILVADTIAAKIYKHHLKGRKVNDQRHSSLALILSPVPWLHAHGASHIGPHMQLSANALWKLSSKCRQGTQSYSWKVFLAIRIISGRPPAARS